MQTMAASRPGQAMQKMGRLEFRGLALPSRDQAGFAVFLSASRDINSATLKTKRFEYAPQMTGSTAIRI
jgi:hypothetical protein